MATCSLKIELDEPQRVRVGGEIVTGTIHVQCNEESNCKGLEIATTWSTHGRGNIDSGDGELVVAFQGQWQAGQEYRYPFKLTVANWPPTYYGHYLNVSHSLRAQAKLAWKTDVKAQREFAVVAKGSPVDLQPARKPPSGAGKFIVWVLLAIFAAVFGFAFIWLVPVLAIVGGLIWFFRFFLPKQITGVVKCEVQPGRLRPGEYVKGHLSFTPKRSSSINRVIYTVSCNERCVSGSGSNRKTHTHELVALTKELLPATRLQAGQLQSFDFEYQIPLSGATSMKLSDNEISWSITCRIDIPSWPDWTATLPFIVDPKIFDPNEPPVVGGSQDSSRGESQDYAQAEQQTEQQAEWFDQVLEQLESSDDPQRLQLVLEAIRPHEFPIELFVDDELESVETSYVPEVDGKWMYAYDDRRELAVILFVPHHLAAAFAEDTWRGRIGIVDYSSKAGSLYARVLAHG